MKTTWAKRQDEISQSIRRVFFFLSPKLGLDSLCISVFVSVPLSLNLFVASFCSSVPLYFNLFLMSFCTSFSLYPHLFLMSLCSSFSLYPHLFVVSSCSFIPPLYLNLSSSPSLLHGAGEPDAGTRVARGAGSKHPLH